MFTIKYWQDAGGKSPVLSFVRELDAVAQKRVDKLLMKLTLRGRSLSLPLCKHLRNGLFELKDIGRGPGYRLYFCWDGDEAIFFDAGMKKSQKRNIETASKRMGNYFGEKSAHDSKQTEIYKASGSF